MKTTRNLIPDFGFGSQVWPGVAKLIEEAGEVQQVLGKLVMTGGQHDHWDGTNLRERLTEEIADLQAACRFVAEKNGFDLNFIETRIQHKLVRFQGWHDDKRDYCCTCGTADVINPCRMHPQEIT